MEIDLYGDEGLINLLAFLYTVCGTTGKRKACKDCSCGLAEELEQEGMNGVQKEPLPKSSCGSVSVSPGGLMR